MLALLFEIGGQRYALDVAQVRRVVPYVHLRQLPGAPRYVAGIFEYHGGTVPVIDLSQLLIETPVAALLSTRIILVDYPVSSTDHRLLGLLAERATDSMENDAANLISSGIAAPEAPYMGDLSATSKGLVQYIKIEQLLPLELRERLFVEA